MDLTELSSIILGSEDEGAVLQALQDATAMLDEASASLSILTVANIRSSHLVPNTFTRCTLSIKVKTEEVTIRCLGVFSSVSMLGMLPLLISNGIPALLVQLFTTKSIPTQLMLNAVTTLDRLSLDSRGATAIIAADSQVISALDALIESDNFRDTLVQVHALAASKQLKAAQKAVAELDLMLQKTANKPLGVVLGIGPMDGWMQVLSIKDTSEAVGLLQARICFLPSSHLIELVTCVSLKHIISHHDAGKAIPEPRLTLCCTLQMS